MPKYRYVLGGHGRRGALFTLLVGTVPALAGMAAQTPAGGAQPCDGTRLVSRSHAVCGADNFWHIVSDDYYACRDGKPRVYRTHDEKTPQRCVDPQPVPPPVVGRAIKCDDPAGDVEVPACINNSWHRLTYQRFKCDDGTFVTSGPPKRTEMVRPPQDCSTWSYSQPIPAGVLTTPAPRTVSIGLVFPRDLRAGERATASVTRTPRTFTNIPALRVVEFEVPATPGPQPMPSIEGVRLEIAGHAVPAAEGPVEFMSQSTISISAKDRSAAGNEVLLRSLGQRDFAGKPFVHEGRIKSKQGGGFRIDSLVVPCFAPIAGSPVGSNPDEHGEHR